VAAAFRGRPPPGSLFGFTVNGTFHEITDASVDISNVIAAPNNGPIYFTMRGCALARIPRVRSEAMCVGGATQMGGSSTPYKKNPLIQFDAAGRVYFVVWVSDRSLSNGGRHELRRLNTDDSITQITNGPVFLTNFLVLKNGDVLFTGSTATNSLRWARNYVAATGSVSAISDSRGVAMSDEIYLFQAPNGAPYVITPFGGIGPAIYRYISDGLVDPRPWFAAAGNGAYFNYTGAENSAAPICGNTLALGSSSYLLGICDNKIIEFFPSPQVLKDPSLIKTVTKFIAVSNTTALVFGLDLAGTNKIVLYNRTANTETILYHRPNLPNSQATAEVEVYNVAPVLKSGRVYFDGLRFSDNKFIFGYIDFLDLPSNGGLPFVGALGNTGQKLAEMVAI
jgi:hypothetical protein